MPDRYMEHGFTEDQAHFLVRERRSLLIRVAVVIGIVLIGVVAASAYGIHLAQGKADKGQLSALQTQQIKDAARLSLDNCRRSQNGRQGLRVILDAFGAPRTSPSYTPEQQAAVTAAYAKIDKFHALDVPVCPGDKPKPKP